MKFASKQQKTLYYIQIYSLFKTHKVAMKQIQDVFYATPGI